MRKLQALFNFYINASIHVAFAVVALIRVTEISLQLDNKQSLSGFIFFGTIAQNNIGLYEAQKQFFSSFFFFWHGIPLPGGYLTLSIMTLNLSCKFIFNSIWSVQKIGSHIAHLSIGINLSFNVAIKK